MEVEALPGLRGFGVGVRLTGFGGGGRGCHLREKNPRKKKEMGNSAVFSALNESVLGMINAEREERGKMEMERIRGERRGRGVMKTKWGLRGCSK